MPVKTTVRPVAAGGDGARSRVPRLIAQRRGRSPQGVRLAADLGDERVRKVS